MLPYTPLHYLLMEGPFKALVMTSGNMTEEPINIDNQDAFDNLAGIADFFLVHNRDIHLRSDDSVLRVVDGNPRHIRRSRGYVPVPVFLPREMKHLAATLAVGAELKNTICLTKENRAFISQHIGDMENLETLEFFKLTVHHLKRILEIHPAVLAHDLHPDYLSSQYARQQDELPTLAVQHHHAHIVSCLAEHGLNGPVIGIALDGTGYGQDAAIWGGEILFADLTSFRRAGHLAYVPLPGGDAAARYPWRMALVYLDQAFGEDFHDLPLPFVRNLDDREAGLVLKMIRKGINAPLTSSCGRLFDAVSALLGIRHRIAFEGQAAIELEMSQTGNEKGVYAWDIEKKGGLWVMQTPEIIKGIVADLIEGLGRGVISRRFHNTLIGLLTDACLRVRDESGINEIALSGGALQNATLLTGLTRSLRRKEFTVYSQAKVPSNDGGLSLGQAVCAGLRYAGWKGQFE
jgi:hydrogenase maturation protein HypF